MAGYGQYCPVARAAEIVSDRWTLLILRELIAGSRHFNAIERGLPGISRSLLAARLQALVDGGVLLRREGARPNATEYELTEAGRDLHGVIDRIGAWGGTLGVWRAQAGGTGSGPAAVEGASAHPP